MSSTTAWARMLRHAGRWADEVDRDRLSRSTERSVVSAGTPAVIWALARSTVTAVGAPVIVPTLTLAAMRTAHVSRERIEALPDHLHALAEGRRPPLRAERTRRLPGSERYLITSDLHRTVPGRHDWPRLQGVKDLYAQVLEGYAEDGWHLVENGDVEDFWMVGGSTWGVVYDIAGMAERAARTLLPDTTSTYLEHLDRIVANNERIYRVLAEGFGAAGRYHRTMGNHDDAFAIPAVAGRLAEHLPGTEVADTILLTAEGAAADSGIAGIDAVLAHGHLTDSWNGPRFAALGRAVTALSTTLADLQRSGRDFDDGRPPRGSLDRLLEGGWNRLITIDQRFGGNRRLDTLDEQRVFARLAAAAPEHGWPWLVHGHTHYPMLEPLDPEGRPVRYANSGCGVLDGAFTALEWDGSDPERPLRLIVWTDRGGARPERIELVADGSRVRAAR